MTPVSVLAINCSPRPGGRTRTALEAVLEGATAAGAATELLELGEADDIAPPVAALERADAFVFGSPMYRASYAAPFKALLDRTPRGMWGDETAPLTGRAALTVATGASDHHFLGPRAMRDVLVDFFAAHVVSPGVYAAGDAYDENGRLTERAAERIRSQGRALVELAEAIRTSVALRAVTPNA